MTVEMLVEIGRQTFVIYYGNEFWCFIIGAEVWLEFFNSAGDMALMTFFFF